MSTAQTIKAVAKAAPTKRCKNRASFRVPIFKKSLIAQRKKGKTSMYPAMTTSKRKPMKKALKISVEETSAVIRADSVKNKTSLKMPKNSAATPYNFKNTTFELGTILRSGIISIG